MAIKKTKKTILCVMLIILLCVPVISGCTSNNSDGTDPATTSDAAGSTDGSEDSVTTVNSTYFDISVEYDSDDLDDSWSSTDAIAITLNGDSAETDKDGAAVSGSTVTITAAGTYVLSGTLSDGQVIVDAADDNIVRLVLNGASITCETSAPIYIKSADKVILILADGTDNSVTDGSNYVLDDTEEEEPSAAIFSKDDLTINGGGSLTISANYQNGIQSKDDLKITGGAITVTAASDGLKGKDCVAVKDGTITVMAAADGIESSNGTDDGEGYIAIEGGTLDITAGLDGIQAETSVLISGGDITISSGGGSVGSSTGSDWGDWGDDESGDSAKGIKAAVDITITGGTISIDSSDDAIHTNDSITIGGGTIAISSGDDGIHSGTALSIGGGDITITKSYEGIESAAITIDGGNTDITASDDGINTAGGNDSSSVDGRPGQNDFSSSGDYTLDIGGGYVVINAGGDGIDANGTVTMTDGTVIVNGPTDSGNGPLDFVSFQMDGGFLVAVGSSGMALAPGTSSAQYSLFMTCDSTQSAGTLIHIETEDGEELLTFAPAKQYQSIVFSSPGLENGASYTVYSGGNASGADTNGLYTGGTYSGGSEVSTFTVSSIITSVGSGATGGGNMMNNPGGGHR
ncbi:MAG: carbohydrate-binding domain-containing protein [Eubacteriales bacterium]|nr:carbohydrate-binding domain-containing protein [Eubacteriales bacterium]